VSKNNYEQQKKIITKAVRVGSVIIGGGFPVSVQTMWKKPVKKINAGLLTELEDLHNLGCDIIRFAVPDMESAEIIGELADQIEMPLVADIHFDYKIALRVLDYPISKVRINPGNIGNKSKVSEVIKKSADKDIPIRIGVNAGSLPANLRGEKDKALAMIKAAESELEIMDRNNFNNVIFSLKSSSVETTIKANEIFSARYNFPMHIGVTEAGPLIPGIVKNTAAITTLLRKGIGNTVRVSLSSEPENEILTGKEILKTAGISRGGVNIISCPMCGRSVFNVKNFVNNLYKKINTINKDISIAVMGCPVNGPGEAKSADIGITGTSNYAIIFKNGTILKKVSISKAEDVFLEEIYKL